MQAGLKESVFVIVSSIRLNVAMMDIKLDTLLATEVNYPLASARLPPGARTDI